MAMTRKQKLFWFFMALVLLGPALAISETAMGFYQSKIDEAVKENIDLNKGKKKKDRIPPPEWAAELEYAMATAYRVTLRDHMALLTYQRCFKYFPDYQPEWTKYHIACLRMEMLTDKYEARLMFEELKRDYPEHEMIVDIDNKIFHLRHYKGKGQEDLKPGWTPPDN